MADSRRGGERMAMWDKAGRHREAAKLGFVWSEAAGAGSSKSMEEASGGDSSYLGEGALGENTVYKVSGPMAMAS